MKEFKDTIQKYLEQRVAEDPLFAPKFENPKKNIDECCREKPVNGELLS